MWLPGAPNGGALYFFKGLLVRSIQLVSEGTDVDSQKLGRVRAIPLSMLEGTLDQDLLGFGQVEGFEHGMIFVVLLLRAHSVAHCRNGRGPDQILVRPEAFPVAEPSGTFSPNRAKSNAERSSIPPGVRITARSTAWESWRTFPGQSNSCRWRSASSEIPRNVFPS
jgi:hypothetical protein